jgi:membrane-associated phospholipid phosphatase
MNSNRRSTRPTARPSRLLTALLTGITQWLRRWWASKARAWRAWRQRVEEPVRLHFETMEPRLLMSADLMPGATREHLEDDPHQGPTERLAIEPDPDSARAHASAVGTNAVSVTANISGPGTANIVEENGRYVLTLTGTTTASQVSLVVTGTQDRIALGGVTANSAIGTLDLGNANLLGNMTLSGGVATLKLGDIEGANINIGGTTPLTLQVGSVHSTRIQVDTIKSLTASGDFDAELIVAGTATAAYALDNVSINGTVSGLWYVHGRANTVQFGASTGNWRASISGNVNLLAARLDMAGTVGVGGLQLLQVGGATRGLTLMVGADLGTDAALGGTGTAADTFRAGTLARVRVTGDMVNTRITVGIDAVDGAMFDGNDRALGSATQRIQEFIVGGRLEPSALIVAPAWPATVRIGGQNVPSNTLPNFATMTTDLSPTRITLALRTDTGADATDRVTSDPVILATSSKPNAALTFQARVSPSEVFVPVTAQRDASGRWVFDRLLLDAQGQPRGDGPYLVELRATDAAGNISEIARINFRLDTEALDVRLSLGNDSGRSATDGLTRDPAIHGEMPGRHDAVALHVALDPGNGEPVWVDFSAALRDEPQFTVFDLTAAQLNQLAGGQLADGVHTIRVRVTDASGNVSQPVQLQFTLDTQSPSDNASFGVSPADALQGDPLRTSAAVTAFTGTVEPGAMVRLDAQDLQTLAGADGRFSLQGVSLNAGANSLALLVTDAAGNERTVTRTIAREAQAQPDQVLAWVRTGLEAVRREATDPPIATRIMAIESIAVYDTLAAIQGTPAFLVERDVTGPVSTDAAIAAAAHQALSTLFPAQRSMLDAALAAALGRVPAGAAKTAGVALGRDIANAVLAIRAADGSLVQGLEEGSAEVGKWRPTGPMYLVGDQPLWGQVTPFALDSADQFRAPPPWALDSAEYAADFNEVRQLGAASGSTRTADQTQQAHFWADGAGSFTPPGHWALIASEISTAKGLGMAATARLMAQLNVALADAAIAAWDTKYEYDTWRPVHAIPQADTDGNPGTAPDVDWQPLLITPPHPDYVSGHSTFSSAAAHVLAAQFGDDTAFATTSPTLPGVTRSYTSFSQAASEAGASRIYGGIHTRNANAAGAELGRNVAQASLDRFDATEDTRAPNVVLDAAPAYIRANTTLTGTVIDNLAGVAAAEYRFGDGAWQPLALDAQGRFSVATSFALDGSQDAEHTLQVRARDAEGNLSKATSHTLRLDTQAPALTLQDLPDGAAVTAATRLQGEAASASPIVSLHYTLDGGTARSIVFDTATGRYAAPLALGDLAPGSHTLRVVALDAAGNESVLTRQVTMAARTLFGVHEVTPTEGAVDVGVTFRPQAFFTRAVDTSTLTEDTFYATGPDGEKLAATIVPAQDGSFAWLFFRDPLPSSARITLHLKGSDIRAAADGVALDGDGNGTAGGDFSWSFMSVNTTPVSGTRLVGKVVDPGGDLLPMTFDDIRRGPDGVIHTPDDVFLNPIAGARVFVIGRPDLVTTTDANGNFAFDNLPTGSIKIGIDGRTATNAPAGVFFPEMVMDAIIRPGVTNTLMGTMGAQDSQRDNLNRGEVYLPRVPNSAMQQVSNTAPTTITVDAASAPALNEEQRAALHLTIPPGAAVGHDGQVLDNVQMGIATVPFEMVKDMLPVGLQQNGLFITIQAPGVETFTAPVSITFPNTYGEPPGAKLNLLSFDHTTGLIVVNGTSTVSADGKTIVSDPGSGILAPGWHGVAGGCRIDLDWEDYPPDTPGRVRGSPHATTAGLDESQLFFADKTEFSFEVTNSSQGAPGDTFPLYVQITIDYEEFEDGSGGTFTDPFMVPDAKSADGKSFAYLLQAGQSREVTLSFLPRDTQDELRMFGARIHVKGYAVMPDGMLEGADLINKQMDVYRLLWDVDSIDNDARATFPATAASDSTAEGSRLNFNFEMPEELTPTFVYRTEVNGELVDLGELEINPVLNDAIFKPLLEHTPQNSTVSYAVSIKPPGGGEAIGAFTMSGYAVRPVNLVTNYGAFYRGVYEAVDADNALNMGLNHAFTKYMDKLAEEGHTDLDYEFAMNLFATEMFHRFQAALTAKFASVSDYIHVVDANESEDVEPNATEILMRFRGERDYRSVQPGISPKLGFSRHTFEAYDDDQEGERWRAEAWSRGATDDYAFEDPKRHVIGNELYWLLVDFEQAAVATGTPEGEVPALQKYVDYIANTYAGMAGRALGLLTKETQQSGTAYSRDLMGKFSTDPAFFTALDKAALQMRMGVQFPNNDSSVTLAVVESYARRIAEENAAEDPLPPTPLFTEAGTRAQRADIVPTRNAARTTSPSASIATPAGALEVLEEPIAGNAAKPMDVFSLDLGSTVADGPQGAQRSATIYLGNTGDGALNISALRFVGDAAGFSAALAGSSTIDPASRPGGSLQYDNRALTVTFDPNSAGAAKATLEIVAETGSGTVVHKVHLKGSSMAAAGTLHVGAAGVNLGGGVVGAAASVVEDAITLRNMGAAAVSITELLVNDPSGAFKLVNLPAGFSAAQPIVLQSGESIRLDASFAASKLGLQRATLTVRSSDAAQPTQTVMLSGTGTVAATVDTSANAARAYVGVQNRSNPGAPVLNGRTDDAGHWDLFSASNAVMGATMFNATSGLVARGEVRTQGAGGTSTLNMGVFAASRDVDTDGDGLSDEIELAIGSNAKQRDTNRDGIDDFVALQQGQNPLGLQALPIGPVAALQLPGEVRAVAVASAPGDADQLTAYAALLGQGLAIVDVSNATKPVLQSRLDLPEVAVDVTADAARGLALVASTAGLHIVDVRNPQQPVLRNSVDIGAGATSVLTRDGFAYVVSDENDLFVIDVNTGEIVSEVEDAGSQIAIDGALLFAASDNNLTSYAIEGQTLRELGEVHLGSEQRVTDLFVGGGVAYVAGSSGGASAFYMVNVSNPAAMVVASDRDTGARTSVVANGAGLALMGNVGNDAQSTVRVMDVRDPTKATRLVTSFNTPGSPGNIAIANGMAFMAAGTGGLQVLNFAAADTNGVAPTVSVAAQAADADASRPGTQVVEGRPVTITPTVADDVQVRNVEVLVNGQVVATDASFPWTVTIPAPVLPAGVDQMRIQVRVTDTGGNEAVSNVVALDVVRDTAAPRIVRSNIEEGGAVFTVPSIDLEFDEPLDLARLDLSRVHLVKVGGGAETPIPVQLDTRALGQVLSVLPQAFLAPGSYELRLAKEAIADRAGNMVAASIVRHFTVRGDNTITAETGTPANPAAPSANPGQRIAVQVPFDPSTARLTFQTTSGPGSRTLAGFDAAAGIAFFDVPLNAITGDVLVHSESGGSRTDYPNETFQLQIVPKITGIQVESISPDGTSANVLIAGAGFIEGAATYRFGGVDIVDNGPGGPTVGPDGVRLTLPLTDGVFGAIKATTAGGSSADFTAQISSITGTAASGTPANAAQASANAGQSITVVGQALSTDSDLLMRWTDQNGNVKTTLLQPISASADGTQATVVVPPFANGAFGLRMLGTNSQPLLQIVPTLTSVLDGDTLRLAGSGFVEGASTYTIGGVNVTDSSTATGVNVVLGTNGVENTQALADTAALPRHGAGPVQVQTAGGTSVALDVRTVRPGTGTTAVGPMRDATVDPATGNLWVADAQNPARLLRIDPLSGTMLGTLALPAEAGSPSTDVSFSFLRQPITLNGTSVPAGSILLVNGASAPDRVVAIHPTTGAAIASLALADYNAGGAAYDAATNRLWVLDGRGSANRIAQVNLANGQETGSIALPFSLSGAAAMTIHPDTGNVWVAGFALGANVVELRRDGSELRRFDLAQQNLAADPIITGLAFGGDGALTVATANGLLLRPSLEIDVSVKLPTLTRIVAVADQGVAAQAGVAAANAGQVIELEGTNFNSGTRVLFETLDNDGVRRVVSAAPLLVNATGTRLQVRAPDLATTGDVRVVNSGTENLGAGTANDSVYRDVTVSFTADGSTAAIRFADGGLEAMNDESWGIDNVRVTRDGQTVFEDDFESGAKAQWSRNTVDASALATLTRFSGRFNGDGGQTLNLSGLEAGRTYTLRFNLLVLDRWEGASSISGPDVFGVTVNGQSVLRETFANLAGTAPTSDSVQSYGQSEAVRLQIVPTLASVGLDNGFIKQLTGSGFMEGASTISVGGKVLVDNDPNIGGAFDVSGDRNGAMTANIGVALDGPIRVATEGGYAELPSPWTGYTPTRPPSGINITTVAARGVPADPTRPSANVGQRINVPSNLLPVQFQGMDDSGTLGTITDNNSARVGNVMVPSLARTGTVTILSTGEQFELQIVPSVWAMSGTVQPGGTLVLEGSGMNDPTLSVLVDGRPVTDFEVQTIPEDSRGAQLLTLKVPDGAANAVVTVRTAGGTSTIRTGATAAAADASVLTGITAVASSGTPSHAALPSANTAQQIVITGNGLRTSDRVMFEVMDAMGNVSTLAVTPSSIDVAAGTLTVTVPDNAVTGAVRLQRDPVGLFLQIVPTLSDVVVTDGGLAGEPITLTGTGFAEGRSRVHFGTYQIDDSGNASGLDVRDRFTETDMVANGEIQLRAPQGAMAQGPLRVSTLGGTSAPLALSASTLQAVAANGLAADPTKPSANPGQSVSLQGAGLSMATEVVFQVVDAQGVQTELVVHPTSVSANGTQAQVTVPLGAVSGAVFVLGDGNGQRLMLQVVPVLVSAQVQSISADGLSATVLLKGLGFIEADAEYHVGNTVVWDASATAGAEVSNRNEPGGSVANGQVLVRVPVQPGGTVGSLTVVTRGGRSVTVATAPMA